MYREIYQTGAQKHSFVILLYSLVLGLWITDINVPFCFISIVKSYDRVPRTYFINNNH